MILFPHTLFSGLFRKGVNAYLWSSMSRSYGVPRTQCSTRIRASKFYLSSSFRHSFSGLTPWACSVLLWCIRTSFVVASSHVHSSRGFSDRLIDRTKVVRDPKRERERVGVGTYRTAVCGNIWLHLLVPNLQTPSTQSRSWRPKFSP